ncbi:NUDIX hydrolase [Patescibacteria group bacterium]|nr:NUDIX hydrolase [Patescibacteria group bacterium]
MDQSLQKFPRACVKIIFRCSDYILYYRTRKGIKDIPGGHIHFGETILGALKRELDEEIGFKLKLEPQLIDAWTYLSKDGLNHRVYFVYLLDVFQKIKFKSKEYPDGIEFIWLHKDEILKADIMPQQKELFLKAVNYLKK